MLFISMQGISFVVILLMGIWIFFSSLWLLGTIKFFKSSDICPHVQQFLSIAEVRLKDCAHLQLYKVTAD